MKTRVQRLIRILLQAVVFGLLCGAVVAEEEEKVGTLSFNDADIRELIHFVSDKIGADSVIIDPLVKGKVDVISRVSLSREEMYDLFLNVLDVHGYTAINSAGVLRIIPTKKARSAPASVVNGGSTNSGFITKIITLKNVSAAKILPVLRPLVPQNSHIAASGVNALVISDTSANVSRIERLVRQLDTASRIETELVSLNYAPAEEIVAILEKLQQSSKAADAQQLKLTLVAETRTNSVLVKGDDQDREEVKTLIRQLDRPGKQTGNIRAYYLQHADAESLAGVLKGVINSLEQGGQGASAGQQRSAVVADPDTNSLIITAQDETLDSLLQVIERLDIRRSNVVIEAVIAEVNDTLNRDLGVEWFFTDEDRGTLGSSVNGTGSRLAGLADAIGNSDDDTSTSTAIAGALTAIPGQTLGIGRIGRLNSTVDFSVVLNALHDDTDTNILATPHLTTIDNNEAEFNNGQEVPFVTGQFTSTGNNSNPGNPFQTVNREDVGIILRVTPHINQGGNMELEIYQEVSSIDADSTAGFITNNRSISTSVRVDDGEMIVLGGLIRDDLTDVQTKVPLLGSIPWLGRLFRSNSTELRKTNLMVFIRARILHDNNDTYDFTAEKYDFIRKRQLEMREGSNTWLDKDQMPVLPEWSQPRPEQQLEQTKQEKPQQEQTGQAQESQSE